MTTIDEAALDAAWSAPAPIALSPLTPEDEAALAILDAENAERRAAKEAARRLPASQGDSVFSAARRAISRELIADFFHSPGAYWQAGEFKTRSPLRDDRNIGSFSISEDGKFYDFSTTEGGGFVELVAKSRGISELQAAETIVAHAYTTNTGARRMFAPPLAVEVVKADQITGCVLGEFFAKNFEGKFMFVHEFFSWYEFDGQRWTPDVLGRAQLFAKNALRELLAAGREVGITKTNTGSIKARETASGIASLLVSASVEPQTARSAESLDTEPWLLNCQNGVLDLRTLELRDAQPDDLLTKVAGVPYAPGPTPIFDKFLIDITMDRPELVAWIVSFLGLCLAGDTSAQTFTVFYGAGANGKSVLVNLMRAIMGDYFVATRAETLMETGRPDSGGSPRADLLALRGARLVVASESEAGATLNAGLIKSLSGEDIITARGLYAKVPVQFKPQGKIVLVTNHRPAIKRIDDAIIRRLRLVPFDRVFARAEQDPSMGDKLAAEGPAILAKLAAAAKAFFDAGRGPRALPPCSIVEDATRSYAEDEDSFGRFLEDETIRDASASTAASDLYARYSDWALSWGAPRWSAKAFGQELARRGFEKKHTMTGAAYSGLRLAMRSEAQAVELAF